MLSIGGHSTADLGFSDCTACSVCIQADKTKAMQKVLSINIAFSLYFSVRDGLFIASSRDVNFYYARVCDVSARAALLRNSHSCPESKCWGTLIRMTLILAVN